VGKNKIFHDFEFKTSLAEIGCATTILIDGVPLKGVINADIHYAVNDIPYVELRLFASEIKIESEKIEVDQGHG
jgi:hypothetical protein